MKHLRRFNEGVVKLPDNWSNHLLKMPETGMGYQIVDIELQNGEILTGKKVVNNELLILGQYLNIEDIKDIKLSKN